MPATSAVATTRSASPPAAGAGWAVRIWPIRPIAATADRTPAGSPQLPGPARPFSALFLPQLPALQIGLAADFHIPQKASQLAELQGLGAIHQGLGGAGMNIDQHHVGTCHHTLGRDRKSTRLNSSHVAISYAVFCLKKKKAI